MKKAVITIFSALLAVYSLAAFAGTAGAPAEVRSTTVTELISAKDSPTGEVRFEGKVIKTFPAEKMLGLADPEKCKTGCDTPCAPELLPVKWEGEMPEVNSTVRVLGAVSKENGKKVLVASSVKKAVKSSCCDQ